MKVMLLVNTIPNCISGKNSSVGWIDQVVEFLDSNKSIDLAVCSEKECTSEYEKILWGNNSVFFGIKNEITSPYKYNKKLETRFKNIINIFNPDIVHIFGTEFPHTLAIVKAFENPEKTVIHIQGLVSIYSNHYTSGLPYNICKKYTFRDFIRQDNIQQQQKKFSLRGKFEIESLKNVKNVMGRTDWDKSCTTLINPKLNYFYVQEIMRSCFYNDRKLWSSKKCESFRIFMSQGNYPIKGLHYALEIVSYLKQFYPSIKLVIAGESIIHNVLVDGLKNTSYANYIKKVIEKNDLNNCVSFTGRLNSEEMKKEYMKANVFLSPSTIENSPNSVAEAMLVGTPVVASFVGGVASIIKHQEEAFLYPLDSTYLAAFYIKQIFDDSFLAEKLSNNAFNRAKNQYNPEIVYKQIIDVYNKITESEC